MFTGEKETVLAFIFSHVAVSACVPKSENSDSDSLSAVSVLTVRDENNVIAWLEYVRDMRLREEMERGRSQESRRRVRWRMRRWIWSVWWNRDARERMKELQKKKLQRPRGALHKWAHAEREITDRITHAIRCDLNVISGPA